MGKSIIATITLYSNKSRTSLRAGALTFYLLHTKALKFIGKVHREYNTSNRGLLVYLVVANEAIEEDTKPKKLNLFETG